MRWGNSVWHSIDNYGLTIRAQYVPVWCLVDPLEHQIGAFVIYENRIKIQ